MNTNHAHAVVRMLADTVPHADVSGLHAAQRPPDDGRGWIERYELVSALGEGGMGRVTLVHDRHVGRDAAVKSLREDLAEVPYYRERFLHEARIQARLEHPSIVPLYDVSDDGDAPPRFSMRYVRGERLADVLQMLQQGDPEAARRYPRRRLLAAFVSVCDAAHYAHRCGVLHGDLKPENVMLDERGGAYLIDWGVARELVARDGRAATHRPPGDDDQGCVFGTPGFIAPEAWMGCELDARADVYSLGATLFEILTHEPYNSGESPNELMRSTISPRQRTPSTRRPDLAIPPELDRVCARAVAFDRDARHADAGALRDDVLRCLEADRDEAPSDAAAEPPPVELAPSRDARVAPWAHRAWLAPSPTLSWCGACDSATIAGAATALLAGGASAIAAVTTAAATALALARRAERPHVA